MASQTWTFEQLGGARRKLELSGHAAPFGGARREPVVEEEIELRHSEVYYDGNGRPTRHLAGDRQSPWILHGIWMDRRGGVDFARRKKTEVKEFIRDAQPVRVTWGDTVSIEGIILRGKFGIEAEWHVVWELEIAIDEDLLSPAERRAVQPETKGPSSVVNQILLAMVDMEQLTEPLLRGTIFDMVDNLANIVNGVTAELRQTADEINSYANAPFAGLRRLRAGLGQLRTAVTTLRRTYDELQANLAIENENATEWQRFWDVQAAWSVSSLEIIRLTLEAERDAARAEQGRLKAFYTAREGDTWEGVSIAVYADAGRAEDIRAANGVDGGAAPVPGTVYFCPK